MGNNCVKCGRVELDHPHFKSAKGPNCKQFIPNHSPSSHVTEDKDPDSGNDLRHNDSGSDIPLSDKIMKNIIYNASTSEMHSAMWLDRLKTKESIEKDVAEFIRLLKEAKQIGNNYYECGGSIWLKDSVIDKLAYPNNPKVTSDLQ